MNRRSFLTGLLALPALPIVAELGRVYSFPTNIAIADHREILLMWETASGWKTCNDVIKPYVGGGYTPSFNTQSNLPRSTVKFCGPRFRENLKDRTPFSPAELAVILTREAVQGMQEGRVKGWIEEDSSEAYLLCQSPHS